MTTIHIEHSYTATAYNEIDLPDGKTWEDVDDYYVKWCELHVFFKDGTEMTYDAGVPESDSMDTKRPSLVEVYPVDENGNPQFDKPIDSTVD